MTNEPAVDFPPLTFEPVSTSVFEGICDDRNVLEDWLQVIEFQHRDFIILMRDGVEKSPDELYLDVEFMSRIRNRVAEQVTPDCAEGTFTTLLGAMEIVLQQFQAYVNGETVNLMTTIDTVSPMFARYEELRDELLLQLNEG